MEFNKILVEQSRRLIAAARPFGRAIQGAVAGSVDLRGLRESYASMAQEVEIVARENAALTPPELPLAAELLEAHQAFVRKDVDLVAGAWKEVVELLESTSEASQATKDRINALVTEAGVEEDRLLANLHQLQAAFFEQSQKDRATT